MTRSTSASSTRPRPGPGREPQLGDQVGAVDRERRPVEHRPGPQLRRDPRPQLAQLVGVARHATAGVVRLAQREQLLDRAGPDLADEPPDRGVRPDGLVAEHVLADEVGDPLGRRARLVEPLEERPGQLRADGLVAVEVAVGRGRRLADVVDERGEPDDRVGDRARRPSRACDPRGPRRGSCSGARRACAASSGRTAASRPVVGQEPEPDRRSLRGEDPVELHRDPLAGEVGGERRARARIAASVAGSISKPSVAARRTARSIRSASSSNRVPGSPTARSVREAVSARARRTGRRRRGDVARRRAPGHRVDREVAAGEVGLERRPELDPVGPPEVGVVVVAPERRDLVLGVVPPDGDRPERVLVRGVGEDGERLARAARRSRGPSPSPAWPSAVSRSDPPTTYAAWPACHSAAISSVDVVGNGLGDRRRVDRAASGGVAQFRPRNRYVRHASLRWSARYGVNSE